MKKIKDIIAYIQGNIRYKLYYSKFYWLIRTHIRQQIIFRTIFMNNECYEQGSCVLCGCRTTALQMANKQCDEPCYPRMMSKDDWETFKIGFSYKDGKYIWIVDTIEGKSILYRTDIITKEEKVFTDDKQI